MGCMGAGRGRGGEGGKGRRAWVRMEAEATPWSRLPKAPLNWYDHARSDSKLAYPASYSVCGRRMKADTTVSHSKVAKLKLKLKLRRKRIPLPAYRMLRKYG